jgi:hypothetical protein
MSDQGIATVALCAEVIVGATLLVFVGVRGIVKQIIRKRLAWPRPVRR